LNRIPYSLVYVEISILIDDTFAFWFALIGAIGSAATAGALIFVGYQTSQTRKQIQQTQEQTKQAQEQTRLIRKEMETTLRPWLGFGEWGVEDDHTNIEIKNYGRVAAKVFRSYEILSSKEITFEEIRSISPRSMNYYMVFPNNIDKYQFLLSEPPDGYFVGLLIKYTYDANIEGESGIIGKYYKSQSKFHISAYIAK
jgi:hypothetical protein